MTQQEKIEQEIGKTLESLDGVQRAKSNPYLFTRIKARMDRSSSPWERTFSFVSKPLVALAILVLVMTINGWVIFGNNTKEVIAEPNNNTAFSELASEYNTVASVNNYDYENNTPDE